MGLSVGVYLLTSKYLEASFELDIKKFGSLLTKNVEMIHTTISQEGIKTDQAEGKEEVLKTYQKNFFKLTKSFLIKEVSIHSDQSKATFNCKVIATKEDKEKSYQVQFLDHTVLEMIEEDHQLKVAKIVSKVNKTYLSF